MKLVSFIEQNTTLLIQGTCMTLKLWLSACILSLLLGTLWGILRCPALKQPLVAFMVNTITFVLRAIPFYVQLLIVYFVLPDLIGISLPGFVSGIVALSLCSGAYTSQIILSGINAIPQGQWEAAQTLGYSSWQTLRYVVIPQVAKIVTPALIGEGDQLLKSTSIISSIGILEITGIGRNIIARDMNPITTYLAIACIYLCLSSCFTIIVNRYLMALLTQRKKYDTSE